MLSAPRFPLPALSATPARRRFAVFATFLAAAAAGGTLLASAQASGRAAAKGVFLKQVPRKSLFPVLGAEAKSAAGTPVGRIVGVLADKTGRPRAAIIDFGGFLGVGTRKIAVDWRALRFVATPKHAIVIPDLTPDQLKSAPEYKATGKNVAVMTPAAKIATGSDAPPGQ